MASPRCCPSRKNSRRRWSTSAAFTVSGAVLVIAVSLPTARKMLMMLSACVKSLVARSASAVISWASCPDASRMGSDEDVYLRCWYSGTWVTLLSPRNKKGTRRESFVILMYGAPSDVLELVALFSCHTRLYRRGMMEDAVTYFTYPVSTSC